MNVRSKSLTESIVYVWETYHKYGVRPLVIGGFPNDDSLPRRRNYSAEFKRDAVTAVALALLGCVLEPRLQRLILKDRTGNVQGALPRNLIY